MPRPQKDRIIHEPPLFSEFKPVGVASRFLDAITLTLDEFEAFRLADMEGFSQEEAAMEMEISRSTFTRLIEKARKKVAEFMVYGRVLSIDGGNIHFRNNIIRCIKCGHVLNTAIRMPVVVCPECGSEELISLAGGFGHGNCCTDVIQKKGGKHARRRQNRSRRNGANDR